MTKIRYDINGLRAIAVMAVLLFHFNSAWSPGGFLGVDIFFVISGFLMTGIIYRGFENNNFSLVSFYVSRIKRIVPALTVVSFLLLLIGFWLIEPVSYQEIGQHVKYSIVFVSNLIYRGELDYFDPGALSKFMLHTWSLAVEWQFYILYPVVLLFVKRLVSHKNLKRLLIVVTIVGFLFSVFATIVWPASAYYFLSARVWEMTFGGIAYLYPWHLQGRKKIIPELLGVVLILLSCAFLSNESPWPGYFAMLPVLGTYLILVANNQKSIITNNPICQRVGTWSYSIYLYHWPILALSHAMNFDINFLYFLSIVLILSFLSYYYIESYRWRIIYIIPAAIVLFSCSSYISSDGLSLRVNEDFRLSRQQFRNKFEGHVGIHGKNGAPAYINSNEEDFDYILLGDSHARHYNSFFLENKIKIASLALDGCSSTKNFYKPKHYDPKLTDICKNRYFDEVDFIKKHPGKKIIISKSWPGLSRNSRNRETGERVRDDDIPDVFISELKCFIDETKGFADSFHILGRNQGDKIIAFQYLAKHDLPIYRLTKTDLRNKKQKFEYQKYNQILTNHAKQYGYHFIDPSPALCSNEGCFIIKNNVPIYSDHTHLSKIGASIVGQYIMNKIDGYELKK